MPDNTEKASLEHVEKIKSEHTNHLVRHDPDIKGEVDIEVRLDGRFNVTVYKGTDNQPQKIEDISKSKLLELIDDRL